MKYSIGEIVHTPRSSMVTITDCEYIVGINLYYTSDNSSYPETDLSPMYTISENKINDFIIKLKPTELQPRTYEEYKKDKLMASTTIVTRNSWLRKIVSHLSKLGRRICG